MSSQAARGPRSGSLQDRFAALVEKHAVPGASLAVAVGDETMVAVAGVLNVRTGSPVTNDSLFQIGSITKVWTATLVMQLVDEGLVDLDVPFVTYVPDFRTADPTITAGVTVRHLLDHTSGIGGDFFPDTGRGDDAIARYVAQMADLPASHPLGATMSYCNSGFVLLGHLVATVRGQTWDTVMRERLLSPLGLQEAGTLPEEALLWGAAVGHFGTQVTAEWGLPRAIGPAGQIHARAVDLVTFARMHLADGLNSAGQRVLSAESVRAMQTAQVTIPGPGSQSKVGLGWMLNDWGRPVYGHDGQTLGQTAFLQIVAGDVPVTLALLTNANHADELYHELATELFDELAGITIPPALSPPRVPVPRGSNAIIGSYERALMSYDVEERSGELILVARPRGVLATSLGTDRIETVLVPHSPDSYVVQMPDGTSWLPVTFYRLADGSPYLHLAGQASPQTHQVAP